MKIKKAVLAMVCVVSVMASMIPVSAAERAKHICVWVEVSRERISAISEGGGTHKATFEITEICQDRCGSGYRTRKVTEDESHIWDSGTDRGHKGNEMHGFDIKCGECGWTQYIEIVCEYNKTGRHNTPW